MYIYVYVIMSMYKILVNYTWSGDGYVWREDGGVQGVGHGAVGSHLALRYLAVHTALIQDIKGYGNTMSI